MIPCKQCIVYAICKLKEEIICDEATEYCRDDSFAYEEYNSERIYEVIDYLGKEGAFEATSGSICFADAFSDEGEKLN
jgi:hypothetical protein